MTTEHERIPLAAPHVPEEGVERVAELLRDGNLSTGEVVTEFEDAFSDIADRDHGIAVASGSVALELALEATFEDGDQIAVSPYNCGAVLYSVLRTGLAPVFVDADPETGSLSAEALRTASADGVLLTHLFGQPANVGPILDAAESIGATVVEDFAQAPGARYDGQPTGSFGRVGVCSFGSTKNVPTGEGGMVVTDESAVAEYVRSQRSNASDVTPPPRSVRMNDLEAALGLSHLACYDEILEGKRAIADVYREAIESVELPVLDNRATHVYHAFPVQVDDADGLVAHLEANDIETSRLYDLPLHKYSAVPATEDRFPGVCQLSNRIVLLPIHEALDREKAWQVATVVEDFAQRANH